MNNISTILAIDTALTGCGVTVYNVDTGSNVSERLDIKRGQAERLVPLIDDVLIKAGIAYDDIDAIAVTNGPGAFTGLRVGLSTARALALSLSVPVIGVSTLDVLKAQLDSEYEDKQDLLIGTIETKRDDFYIAAWRGDKVVNKPSALSAHDVLNDIIKADEGRVRLFGDAAARLYEEVKDESSADIDVYSGISANYLAKLVYAALMENPVSGYHAINVSPLYLKPADVSVSKKTYKTMAQH